MAKSNFEKDLEKLEGIVESLEEGGLSLDDALKRFEEGMKLAQGCEKALSAAEKRIEILIKNVDGTIAAEPFGDSESAPGAGGTVQDAVEGLDKSDENEDEDGGELLF